MRSDVAKSLLETPPIDNGDLFRFFSRQLDLFHFGKRSHIGWKVYFNLFKAHRYFSTAVFIMFVTGFRFAHLGTIFSLLLWKRAKGSQF